MKKCVLSFLEEVDRYQKTLKTADPCNPHLDMKHVIVLVLYSKMGNRVKSMMKDEKGHLCLTEFFILQDLNVKKKCVKLNPIILSDWCYKTDNSKFFIDLNSICGVSLFIYEIGRTRLKLQKRHSSEKEESILELENPLDKGMEETKNIVHSAVPVVKDRHNKKANSKIALSKVVPIGKVKRSKLLSLQKQKHDHFNEKSKKEWDQIEQKEKSSEMVKPNNVLKETTPKKRSPISKYEKNKTSDLEKNSQVLIENDLLENDIKDDCLSKANNGEQLEQPIYHKDNKYVDGHCNCDYGCNCKPVLSPSEVDTIHPTLSSRYFEEDIQKRRSVHKSGNRIILIDDIKSIRLTNYEEE